MTRHPDFSDELANGLESDLFSQAFYRLCAGLDDVDGLIAYGLYKDDKRKALLDRPLKRTDVSFHRIHNHLNDARCDILRENAHRRLKAYVDKVIERSKPGIQRDYAKTHLERTGRGQFWKGVGASLTASFVMLIIFETAPILARQGPTVLADVWNAIRGTEHSGNFAGETEAQPPLATIEPAAGEASSNHDSPIVSDDCLLLTPPFIHPTCMGSR